MKKLLVILALLAASGCASQAIIPFEQDERAIQLLKKIAKPHPWRVAVAPVKISYRLAQTESACFPLEPDLADLRKTIVTRLMNYRIFKAMNPIEEPENASGLGALLDAAWKENYDFLMTVDLEKYDVLYTGTNTGYVPNFLLVLAGLVPSYFVRDEVYAVQMRVKITLYSVDSEKAVYTKTFDAKAGRSLDDFERGWMLLGYFHGADSLRLGNWKKIESVVGPYAKRELELALVEDFLSAFREKAAGAAFSKACEKTLAFVIGVQKHQSTRVADRVSYSRKDAEAFAQLLRSQEGGLLEKHVKLLVDEQATRRNVRDALETFLVNRAKPHDSVILYFAGYGAVSERGRAYLVTHDAIPKRLESTTIPFDALAETLLKIRARQVTVYLDTSFNAPLHERSLFRKRALSSKTFSSLLERDGVAVLTAAATAEGAMELSANKHGIFTFYLLRALEGAADLDHDGKISAKELYANISEKVSVEASLEGASQRPMWLQKDVKNPADDRIEWFLKQKR